MESERFDRLAKLVGAVSSRRTALRGLARGAVGGALGMAGVVGLGDDNVVLAKKCSGNAQCDQPKNPCKKAVCKNKKCRKQNERNGKNCGDGLQCLNGKCVCPNGTCVRTVRPSNMQGWQFYNDQIDQPIDPSMESGPETPPLGAGSALLEIGGSSEGKLLSSNILMGTPIADFETLEYSYYVTSSTSDTAPSFQVGIDFDLTDANEGFQGRMVYVPSATAPAPEGEWVTVNTLLDNGTGNWFFSRQTSSGGKCPLSNPCNLSEILADFPNIGVHPIGEQGTGAGFGFIGMKVGSGEGAVDANVDAVKVKIAGANQNTVVYNFEPDPQ